MLQICVECRKMNSVTEQALHALQEMNGCINSLGYAQVFLTVYAKSGYWNIEFGRVYVEKTALIFHH